MPRFHLNDCPLLDIPVWDDDVVAVAADWALERGYEDAAERSPDVYDGTLHQGWTDYEPEHVREALANNTDPEFWKPVVDATAIYTGYADYWGGHGTTRKQTTLRAEYGPNTTLKDLVDQWMNEFHQGFPGEDEPVWEHVDDKLLRAALKAVFTPGRMDRFFDDGLDDNEDDEDREWPVVIVLLSVTSSGMK